MNIKEIEQIKKQAQTDLSGVKTLVDLEEWDVRYLGRKQGVLTLAMRGVANLSVEDKKVIGPLLNQLKSELEENLRSKRVEFESATQAEALRQVDVTMPGTPVKAGQLHPLTLVQRQLEDIFLALGFTTVEGPELESDYYNFEALNIPKGHPARDMWDTFYVKNPKGGDPLVLRTHTSPMQIRIMEKYAAPLAVVVPGRTYRHEATDARHEHTFKQFEGLVVGENISVANLKYVLKTALSEFFQRDLKLQLRPSYFPFVEPGFEVAVECTFCGGKGCSVCSTGWLELLGAGMVHPKVFESVGYEKGKFSGFAFGMGIERLAMVKYDINDVRLFNNSDFAFLNQ